MKQGEIIFNTRLLPERIYKYHFIIQVTTVLAPWKHPQFHDMKSNTFEKPSVDRSHGGERGRRFPNKLVITADLPCLHLFPLLLLLPDKPPIMPFNGWSKPLQRASAPSSHHASEHHHQSAPPRSARWCSVTSTLTELLWRGVSSAREEKEHHSQADKHEASQWMLACQDFYIWGSDRGDGAWGTGTSHSWHRNHN